MLELNKAAEESRERLKGFLLQKLDAKLEQKCTAKSQPPSLLTLPLAWEFIKEELQEKLDAPGGPALLDCVGYIYISVCRSSLYGNLAYLP